MQGPQINTDHLPKALAEYAETLGKRVEDLTAQQRRQAFCSYMMSGKHLGGAEEAMDEAG